MKTCKIIFKYDREEKSVIIDAECSYLALCLFEHRYDYDEIIDIKLENN